MNKNLVIVGITGTNGAGKGTVVDILKAKGYFHLSVGDYLLTQVRNAGWPENRESLIKMGNDLRTQFGPGVIADRLYDEAIKVGSKVIIESIRTVGEINTLRAKGEFILLGVMADRKIRYERVIKRGGIKDSISFDEFSRSENNEMTSTDPNKQNLGRCIELSDFRIENNGTMEELELKINDIIKNF